MKNMNKSSVLFPLALFLLCFQAQAQRCLPSQRGLEIIAGTANGVSPQNGFYSGIAFSQYAKSAGQWKFGLEYLEIKHPYENIIIPQSQFLVDAGYYLNLLSDPHKTFFVSIGASVIAGYETINWNNKTLFDGSTITNNDNFLYGGALTLEPEIYLTDRFVLFALVSERLPAGSSVGKLNTLFGVGIKYIIN